ncbi:MAG: arylsulfatase A-like enzyme [Verrucomicrobiales bacterium]|jgi:arylsulfatase A-like enzyme
MGRCPILSRSNKRLRWMGFLLQQGWAAVDDAFSPMKPFILLALLLPLSFCPNALGADEKRNVLFIPVDDLNHWVGHLGRNPQTVTPNIDRLAARGVSFSKAYCAAPACNPSRAALMSGRSPSTTGIYKNGDAWKGKIPPAETLNVHLRDHGYHTAASGKIYHGGVGRAEDWDLIHQRPRSLPKAKAVKSGGVGKLSYAQLDGDDEIMPDYHVVDFAIDQLKGSHDEKPFFLACGIFRPHLAWDVPKKYFDMHPLEKIELPPHRADDLDDIPPAGVKMATGNGDHRKVTADDPEKLWKELVQAYLASVSFADAQLGRLLDALDASQHRDNTIIVLWGDHGWSLGEKSHWRKFALWEEPTRAPLIWVAPGVTPEGGICAVPVDFLNIYPTLCDLLGVETPEHCEGRSLRPLLTDPEAELLSDTPKVRELFGWKRPALTTHGRGNHAVRLRDWRYIHYADGSEELYDHQVDPLEHTNLASSAEHEKVIAELKTYLPQDEAPEPKTNQANSKPTTWSERVAKQLPAEENAAQLFDGKTLDGWDGAEEYWSVDEKNGWIMGKNSKPVASSTYLFSEKSYREFRLILEVKQVVSAEHSTMHSAIAALGERFTDKGGNEHGFKGPLLMFCHDWGIWDAYRRNRIEPKEQRGTLKIENENVGKWNRIEILVKGNRVRFVANGKLVFDFTDQPEMLTESPIGLQLHANGKQQEFRFRGLWLSEAPGDALVTLAE